MANEPTIKQIQAWYLVHIQGHTQEEAGDILGVSQRAISYRLEALRSIRAKLFHNSEENRRLQKKIRYCDIMNNKIIQKF